MKVTTIHPILSRNKSYVEFNSERKSQFRLIVWSQEVWALENHLQNHILKKGAIIYTIFRLFVMNA